MTEPQQPSRLQRFFAELRRRHVVRVFLGYAAVVFVLLQLSEIILPAFMVSAQADGVIRVLVIAALLFLPIVLALAWIYEITPQGVRAMRQIDQEAGIADTGRFLPRVMLLLITIGAGWGGWVFSRDLQFESGDAARDTFQAAQTTDASSPITSLAILPLEDQSASPDDAYFAASMHEAITSAVSQLSALRVISRTSVLRYDQEGKSLAQIGAELNVDAIVEGSVVVVEDQVRITVQLIHTASDTHLWAENFTREFVDVLALQQEVAAEIAGEIEARVEARTPGNEVRLAELDVDVSEDDAPPSTPQQSPGPGVSGPGETPRTVTMGMDVPSDVQRSYLRGRYLLSEGAPDQVAQARGFFEDALEEEPGFTPAITGLAGTELVQALDFEGLDRLDRLVRSRELALRALEEDPENAEAREVARSAEEAIADASREFEAATVEGFGSAEVAVIAADSVFQMFSFEDGVIRLPGGDSITVDGGMAPVVTSLGELLQRRFGESKMGWTSDEPAPGAGAPGVMPENVLQQVLRMANSGELGDAQDALEDAIDDGARDWRLFEILEHLYRIDEDFEDVVDLRFAREELLPDEPGPSAADLQRRLDDNGGEERYWSWKQAEYAQRTAAGAPIFHTFYGASYARLGQPDKAIEELRAGARVREPALVTLRLDPAWDELRADDRFRELIRRIRVDVQRRPPRPPGGR